MRQHLLVIFTLGALLLTSVPVEASTSDYVRTANYFLLSGTTLDDKATRATLEKFDLLVLPITAQEWNKDFFAEARKVNPDIIILAYMPTVSWNSVWTSTQYKQFKSGIKSSWWLKDKNGKQVSIWPGTQALDLTGGWSDYLADWTVKNVLLNGNFDGVFYDEVSAEINWIPNLNVTDAAWTNGLANLFTRTRQKSPKSIIVMNGSSNDTLMPLTNGRMFESFPTPWEAGGSWSEIEGRYLAQKSKVTGDPTFVINSNSNNTGNKTDYKKMRYGLTSTLLGDGYFGYDFGTESHGQTWYYDEYDTYLGEPVDGPEDLLTPGNTKIKPSVWARDFDKGKAIVNSTTTSQKVRLDGEYEKLHGTQDPTTNDGRIVSSITIPAEDGIVLLRPLENVVDATFTNGAFVRIFDANGASKRNGFFAYNDAAKGGNQVVEFDLTGDGKNELVTAGDSRVDIYNSNGSLRASFFPYTSNYKLGVNIAIGDLEGDGSVEIVTGTENGGGPQVRIFNKDGVLIHPGFFAYDTAFRGGVNVAIGDLNGDGTKEIISGAGVGGGPHVRVANKDGKIINPGFFAYDTAFRGGVNVAAGDLNGDGIDEIITGPGKGGGPQIKVYTKDGVVLNAGFFAYDQSDRNGVEVSAADLDGDGKDEIIAIGNDVFTLSLF